MVPGKFIDLETETTEPYWSVNVKRGLLSFMQLDLMEEERVRVDPDELRILNKLNIATPPQRSPNKAYRVMEVQHEFFCLFTLSDYVCDCDSDITFPLMLATAKCE